MRICCDLDGVLIDFANPVIAKMNEVANDKSHPLYEVARSALQECDSAEFVIPHIDSAHPDECKASRTYMKALIQDDEEFWASLPWRKGGKQLWGYISQQKDVVIITTPMPWSGSINGRLRWIERELQVSRERIILTHDHSKGEHAFDDDGNPCVLVDDWIDNIEEFKEAGGHTIYYNCLYEGNDASSVTEVIDKLGEYLMDEAVEKIAEHLNDSNSN
tara:strand:+ start:191 stop:844 length:654 start_codon:yes stop_codon:yes gene_type:complete